MKILLVGGSGFIGSTLLPILIQGGHEISLAVAYGKRLAAPQGVTLIEGNLRDPEFWRKTVIGHEAFINLAGSSIFQRWTKTVKQEIYASRIMGTRYLVAALKQGAGEKTVLLNASGIGYYGYSTNAAFDEESQHGNSFLARVAVDWEAEAVKARAYGVRVLLCRFGIVLGRCGGALPTMLPYFRLRLGGQWGNGSQWFSWIHALDCARSILFLLEHDEMEGAVNLTAPHPVTNAEMTCIFSKLLRRRALIRSIPAFLIRAILGERSEFLLKGQRVFPRKLMSGGFQFLYPALEDCLTDLLSPHTISYSRMH